MGQLVEYFIDVLKNELMHNVVQVELDNLDDGRLLGYRGHIKENMKF